jgi:hypothetical protein
MDRHLPQLQTARLPSFAIPATMASAVVSNVHSAPIVVAAVAAQGIGKL